MLPATNKSTPKLAATETAASSPAPVGPDAGSPPRGRSLTGLLSSFRAPATLEAAPTPLAAGPEQGGPASSPAADQLRACCTEAVELLHHRRTPRVRPNIDHLAIAPSGVWVIHSRTDRGRVATRKPMFGDPRLTIAGRERSDLLANLERQVGYVRAVLGGSFADVQVRSAICFIDTEAPLVRMLYLGSYLFFGAPSVATHLNSPGPCNDERVAAITALLEAKFPAA